jgi:hypothetical protein
MSTRTALVESQVSNYIETALDEHVRQVTKQAAKKR